MRAVRFAVIGSALFLIASCSGIKLVTRTVAETGPWDFVRLLQYNDKTGQPTKLGYSQPRQITEQQMKDYLASVRFTENAFFKWRYEKGLFIQEEQHKLAGPLAKAFSEATPDQMVAFAVTARKKDWLLPQRRVTTGYMFFTGDDLHLVLANLNVELTDDKPPASGDPREKYVVNPYRLEPKEHQKVPPKIKGDPYWSSNHTNWLITDWKGLQSTAEQKREEEAKKEAGPKPSTTQRLEELEDLYKKGLISKKEYKKKKEEILNDL